MDCTRSQKAWQMSEERAGPSSGMGLSSCLRSTCREEMPRFHPLLYASLQATASLSQRRVHLEARESEVMADWIALDWHCLVEGPSLHYSNWTSLCGPLLSGHAGQVSWEVADLLDFAEDDRGQMLVIRALRLRRPSGLRDPLDQLTGRLLISAVVDLPSLCLKPSPSIVILSMGWGCALTNELRTLPRCVFSTHSADFRPRHGWLPEQSPSTALATRDPLRSSLLLPPGRGSSGFSVSPVSYPAGDHLSHWAPVAPNPQRLQHCRSPYKWDHHRDWPKWPSCRSQEVRRLLLHHGTTDHRLNPPPWRLLADPCSCLTYCAVERRSGRRWSSSSPAALMPPVKTCDFSLRDAMATDP